MDAEFYDIATTHPPRQFCKRITSPSYFITCFETPVLYELDGALLPCPAGSMLIVEPQRPIYHGPAETETEGFVNDWCYLRGPELEALLEKYPLPRNRPFSVGNQNPLRRYIERVRKEKSLLSVGYQDQILFFTGQLIVETYRLYLGNQPESRANHRIESTRESIMLEPEKQWTLAEMSRLSGYSPSRFSALYKKAFGVTPKQDLLNSRLQLAAHMLKYTGASVTEVSAACGFQSIYYFSRYFKTAMGVSPSEYWESCHL
jgi:AraC-like DNA-binding protein